jgi:hypothetical protein
MAHGASRMAMCHGDVAAATINKRIDVVTLPRRLPNASYRPREYLTEKEVDRLIEAVNGHGDTPWSLWVALDSDKQKARQERRGLVQGIIQQLQSKA